MGKFLMVSEYQTPPPIWRDKRKAISKATVDDSIVICNNLIVSNNCIMVFYLFYYIHVDY